MMEKNYTYRVPNYKKVKVDLINKGEVRFVVGFMLVLMFSQKGHAQFVNNEQVKVDKGTILSVYMDYDNEASARFINDGEVYVFENWMNNGSVDFSPAENGKTFFVGKQEQQIDGRSVSNFQNITFDNLTTLTPFSLKSTIAVGNNTDFLNGIINAADFNGKMIFNENAVYSNVGDQSFVDGMVEKIGSVMFEFPVGDDLFYRPALHAGSSLNDDVYTTQYFYQNSDALYPHANKEDDTILVINDQEYWKVTRDNGSDKIILSLSLSEKTTPAAFYNLKTTEEVAIVRWDERAAKWINEKGLLSDPISGEAYSNLLTGQVNDYGIFTMAIVKKGTPKTGEVTVYNAISPNGDGINDTFHIEGIDRFPDNKVEIYNRWGVKVYDATSYNESDNMFRGYSDGRTTLKRGDKLPTGTYFYILNYNNGTQVIERSGYLYINNQ